MKVQGLAEAVPSAGNSAERKNRLERKRHKVIFLPALVLVIEIRIFLLFFKNHSWQNVFEIG
jgi:hypothetical protein